MGTEAVAGLKAFALLVVGVFLGGCAGAYTGTQLPVNPPLGFLYGSHRAPLQTDFEATPIGSKVGTAKTKYFREPIFTGLPIAAWGNASVEEAAKEGQIRTVTHVDYAILNVLGIYMELTVRAFGD
jgi:hypothetical protein